MPTRGQHCSAEKAALRVQELGASVPGRRAQNLALAPPLAFKDEHDGSECGDYSRGFHDSRNLSPQLLLATHRKFCEIALWGPSSPFYRGEK